METHTKTILKRYMKNHQNELLNTLESLLQNTAAVGRTVQRTGSKLLGNNSQINHKAGHNKDWSQSKYAYKIKAS